MSTRLLYWPFLKSLFVLAILATQVQSQVISNKLKDSLEKNRVGNIIVTFKTRPSDALNRVADKIKTMKNRGERLHILSSELENDALKSQRTTLQLLQSEKTIGKFSSLWLTNQISVREASIDLVNKIGSLQEVLRVEESKTFTLPQTTINDSTSLHQDIYNEAPTGPIALGPYFAKMEVQGAWDLGIVGSGVLVGVIDTGVGGTHDALRDNYVGTKNYGWFDPEDMSKYPYAPKYQSHGTNSIGAVVGSYGVGVAPAAKWMACKAVDKNNKWHEDWVVACLQFMLCPTDHQGNNKNCSKAPHVITNSWYYPSGEDDTVLRELTPVLVESQLHFVFCAGNQGPGCGTVGPPGSYKEFIAVGAANALGYLLDYSSWGPSPDGIIKPDVIGGGHFVAVVSPTTDYGYSDSHGCSMATPAVAGVIALMLQKHPSLSPAEVKQILTKTATNLTAFNDEECGGIPVTQIPNNQIGYGFVNAFKAVNAVPV